MYDLHNLGCTASSSCVSPYAEVLGQTVESLLPTADAGQDGAFSGVWKSEARERLAGRFVIRRTR